MTTLADLTSEHVRRLFAYHPQTGSLVWRVRPRSDFATDMAWRTINSRQAGKIAGHVGSDGYIHVGIAGKLYRAHRLVWLYHYGSWPSDQLDHISHDRSDNRIENLREATDAENRKNQSINRRNTSGVMGVTWFKRDGTWQAKITVRRKQVHLGYFASKPEAIAARRAAERRHGFHRNHGVSA